MSTAGEATPHSNPPLRSSRWLPTVQVLTGTTVAMAAGSGQVAYWTLTGNSTFNMPTGMSDGETVTVFITNGAGPYTVDFHNDLTWPVDVEPVVTATAGAVDRLTIQRRGSAYYAELAPFTVSPFTASRILYADANGLPAVHANLTFDGNKLSLGDTTDASSFTTGTLTSLGGASFAKYVWCRGLVSKRSPDAGAVGCVDIGESAGNATKSGSNVVCIGTTVGNNLTTGFDHFLLGSLCGTGLTTGEACVAVGKGALQNGNVSYSVAIGRNALNSGGGTGNVALGTTAMVFAVGGDTNVAIGYNCMFGVASTSAGSSNVAIGNFALGRYTTGSSNVAIGNLAGDDITSGSGNILIGKSAGDGITTGSNNLRLQNTAAFAVIAGTGINAAAGSQIVFGGTDDSTSKDAGAVVLEGGLGVEKSAYFGNNLMLNDAAATDATVLRIKGGGTTNNYVRFAEANIGGQTGDVAYLRWQRDGGNGRQFSVFVADNSGSSIEALRCDYNGKTNVLTRANLASVAGSAADGDLWNDSTQKAVQTFAAGVEQTLPGVLFTGTASVPLTTTTTETSLLSAGVGTGTLPANFFVAGKKIRLRVWGTISSNTGETLTLRAKLGATTMQTVVFTCPADLTAAPEHFEATFEFTCRTAGGSGTGASELNMQATWTSASHTCMQVGAAGTHTGFDTTASKAVGLTGQFGSASADNDLNIHGCSFEVLN